MNQEELKAMNPHEAVFAVTQYLNQSSAVVRIAEHFGFPPKSTLSTENMGDLARWLRLQLEELQNRRIVQPVSILQHFVDRIETLTGVQYRPQFNDDPVRILDEIFGYIEEEFTKYAQLKAFLAQAMRAAGQEQK